MKTVETLMLVIVGLGMAKHRQASEISALAKLFRTVGVATEVVDNFVDVDDDLVVVHDGFVVVALLISPRSRLFGLEQSRTVEVPVTVVLELVTAYTVEVLVLTDVATMAGMAVGISLAHVSQVMHVTCLFCGVCHTLRLSV